MTTLILGSTSPRRSEILSFFSIPFTQAPSFFDEESVSWTGDPVIYANTISKGKSEALAPHFPGRLILTADTVVFCNQRVYLKPQDQEEGARMLTELSGKWHSVYTSITMRQENQVHTGIEETQVLFQDLSQKQIENYLKQLPFRDKAGSYLIQESGSLIVKQIQGCFYNVMGLPVNTLHTLLLKFEIDLWDHLAP